MTDYISWIRSKVGHDKVFMNFSVALLRNEKGEVLMQQRDVTQASGDFQVAVSSLAKALKEPCAVKSLKKQASETLTSSSNSALTTG
jgi:hypothetical protein